MTHFGILCPAFAGHINPLACVARALQERGHRATFFLPWDLEEKVRSEGVGFHPIRERDYPRGTLQSDLLAFATLKGRKFWTFLSGYLSSEMTALFRDVPNAAARLGIDALIVDETFFVGSSIAERLGIPFVSIASALRLVPDSHLPPATFAWQYQDSVLARARNRLAFRAFELFLDRPLLRRINETRRRWNLPPVMSRDETFSPLLHLSQQPPALEFPGASRPPHFHYVGPLRDGREWDTPFPWDKLTGQPLVYASLGTIQCARKDLFHDIANACAGLGAQLVVSHAGALTEEQAAELSRSCLVVPYAPQRKLLNKCALTITSAGLNTVLDSLAEGVPLVAVPMAWEQFGIAARVTWTGSGRMLPLKRFSQDRLRAQVKEVLRNHSYRAAAGLVQRSIARAGGTNTAAALIEGALAGRHRPGIGLPA